MNTLLLLKSLKILKNFKNFFLSFNGDRALPRMIQNVVLGSFESIFNALSTKPEVTFHKNQVVRSYGVKSRTHYLDLFRTHICVFRSLRVNKNYLKIQICSKQFQRPFIKFITSKNLKKFKIETFLFSC